MNTGKLFFVGVLLVIFIAACGGCSSGSDDPVSAVESFMEALERLDIDKASKQLCESHENSMRNAPVSKYMGLTIDDFKKVVEYQFTDMSYEEKSREGDKAIVHVTGSLKIEYNADKYKELAKKAIEAKGETISDEDLEFLDPWAESLVEMSQEHEIDGELELIKEDGKWKICDDDFDVFDFDYTGFGQQ